jgi:hypothetical protein
MPKIWSLDWWWNNGVILEVSEFWFWLYWLQNMVGYILWCWRQNKSIVYEMIMGLTILMEFSFKGWDKWGVRRRPWPVLLEHCESKFKCFGECSIECFHGTWSLGNLWFWDMWNASKDRRHLNYSSIWNTKGNHGVVCIISVFGKFSHWWFKKSLENLEEPTKNYGLLGISFIIFLISFLEWCL